MTAEPRSERPLRFLVVGAWNTLFGYLAFAGAWALTHRLGVHYMLAMPPAHLLSITNAFYCHRTFVFGPGDQGLVRSFVKFSSVYWAAFGVNLLLLPLFVEVLGLHPLAAQALLIAGVAFTSYVVHGRWSFAKTRSPSA